MSDTDNDASLKQLFAEFRLEAAETAKPVLLCFRCGTLTPTTYDEDVVGEMLHATPPMCGKCAHPIDVWKLMVLAMTVGGGMAFGLPVGLKYTAIFYRLPIGGIKELDLLQEGIPKGAQLHWVAHKIAIPTEALLVDLDATDSSRPPMPRYRLSAIWHGCAPNPGDVHAPPAVLWSNHDADDAGRQQLVRALDSFANGRDQDSLIPATVAVESALARVVEDYFAWVGVSKDRRRSFLRDAATFGHQLNVLSPAIAHHLHAPQLPDHVRGLLNRLRDLRNDAAHADVQEAIDRKELGTCIAAAIVGFRYARMLGEYLERRGVAG